MAKTVTLIEQLSLPTGTIRGENSFSAAAQTSIEETVGIAATDLLINLAIDFSEIVCLFIMADQDLTIETNSGSAPDDTISLVAGKPLIWYEGSYFACPLAADVTKIYVTNASGVAATLQIEVLQDPTP